LNPTNAFTHCNLGLALEEIGDVSAALGAIAEAHRLRPDDPEINYHFAAICAAAGRATEPPPPTCPPAYVTELFDDYAPRFDQHLVTDLGYRGHELLFEIVSQANSEFKIQRSEPADILDLGCGTGLTGVPFELLARSIVGVDLSQRMLDRAAQRRRAGGRPLYDRLIRTDVLTALRESQASYDLVLAADLFIYVGRLEEVFPAVKTALRPGGLFAFTIELLPDEMGDLRLLPTRRYAQSAAYVQRLASVAGLTELARRQAPLRHGDDGQPVVGLVMLLRRQGPANSDRR
jgi:predicted TPR repeat methyltransferase